MSFYLVLGGSDLSLGYLISGIAAGLVAAAMAWLLNGLILKAGPAGVVWLSPGVEEGLKTGLALFFGGAVLSSHITFGLVEAVRDARGGGRGRLAALAGLSTHTALGVISYFVIMGIGLLPALAAAYTTHMLINKMVLRLSPGGGSNS